MVESSINKNPDEKKLLRQQFDSFGTPLPVKTPVNFLKRQASQRAEQIKARNKLILVSCVSCIFISVELVGGWWAGSIAIYADSAHLASDIFGFGISIAAL